MMRVFNMFGTIALQGGQAVVSGLQNINQRGQAAADRLNAFGDRAKEVGGTLTTRLTAPIAAVGVGIIKTGADFEQSMAQLRATTQASGEDMVNMEKLAKKMGAETEFSASQAADAMNYLGMASFDTDQIMASLPDVLDLATAGAMDLGRAADISSNILTQFGMEASEMDRVAASMAQTARSANTNMEQMGYAMAYVGPVAKSAGWDIEQTSAAIGLLANAGYQGEKGGTALRGIIASLANPAGQTKDALESLGFTMEDLDPTTNSMSEILQKLKDANIDTAEAMQLVGVEAGPALLAMLEQGPEKLDELEEGIRKNKNAHKEMADTMRDTTKGGFKELMSAIEGVALQFYEIMRPAVQQVTEWLKRLVDWMAGSSKETKTMIAIIAGIAAAIGPVILGIGILAKAIAGTIGAVKSIVTAFRTVIQVMNLLRVAFLTNPFFLIITAIVIVVALIIMYWDEIKEYLLIAWEWIKDIAVSVWNGIVDFFKEWGPTILALITGPIGWLIGWIISNWDQIKATTEAVWNAIKAFFSNLWNSIKAIVLSVVTWYVNRIRQSWELIKSVTSTVWNGIKKFFSTIWNGIKSVVTNAVNGVRNTISNIWDRIKSITSNLWGSIKDIVGNGIKKAWEAVKGYASRFLSAGQGLLDSLTKGIKKGFTKAVDAVKGGLKKIRSFLPFSPAKEGPLSDLDKSGESFFPTFASKMHRGTRPMLQQVSDGMEEVMGLMQPEADPFAVGGTGAVSPAGGMVGGILITGNTFYVREESDIEKVAQELHRLQVQALRGPRGGLR